MDVNFELYKMFYVVANNKSISKGAEELMISQPAVTQSIKMLEGQLGVTLFVRTKKGVILTDEGEELYKYVKEGMTYFVNGHNKVMSLKKLDAGVLKIGASTSVTEHYLMPYITKFHDLYPNVEIKIVNLLTDVLLKELRNGNVDIVVGSNSDYVDKDLEFYEISEVGEIFVSNKEINLSTEHIFKSNLILQTAPSVARNSFNEYVKKNNINLVPFMEVVSHRLVTELVKAGMGIGVVTEEYVKDELGRTLFKVNNDIKLPKRKLGYTLLKNSVPSYRVKAFINLLKK